MIYKTNDLSKFPVDNGIYAIYFLNGKTDKKYIGSASQFKSNKGSKAGFYSRWRRHLWSLRKGQHHSSKLQNAFNKYAEENMVFEILEICKPEFCIDREQYFIEVYNSYKKGYNGRPKAESNLGFSHKDSFKQNLIDSARKIRDEYASLVIEKYNKNKTTRDISKELNIDRGVIGRILKENNIIARNTASYTKKTLYQFDLEGVLIKEWDSIKLCSKTLCLNENSIRIVLSGQCKHAKGFYFSVEKLSQEEVLKNIESLTIKSKNVLYTNIKQVDKDGNLIKTWRDVRDIKEGLGFKYTNGITSVLRLEKKSYKGFYFNL